MSDGKGNWFRFEDGIQQSENLENELAYINKCSYEQFREKYVNQELAKERRAILFFWGSNSGKRKKGKHIDTDVNATEKLLIESIMDSCTRDKEGRGEFLTAAVIRCETSDINNVAHVHGKEIRKAENNPTKQSAKKFLDEGHRIVDDRKISFWEKYVLINKDIQIIANFLKKELLVSVGECLIHNWVFIIPLLYFFTEEWKENIEKLNFFWIILGSVTYKIVCGYYKRAVDQAKEKVSNEVSYYKCLDYPCIFYIETGKTKRWMIKYIQQYVEGEEGKTKGSVFYIGANNSKLEKNIHKFIIPEGHPEWGLICLCKLVRDLADNPWGEIWSGTAIIDKSKDISVFSPSLEADMQQNTSNQRLKIFKMPSDEKNLWNQIEEKKAWHFARDPSSKDPESKLFPIGDSVYVIRGNISWVDFVEEVNMIQEKILPKISAFKTVNFQFWLIQVDENELEVIEKLSTVQARDNVFLEGIWQRIIQLIESLQNEKIYELCELVWEGKKAKYWMSFADYIKILENSQEDVVKIKRRL